MEQLELRWFQGGRIISPITQARWLAMEAGDEWVGYAQYENARTAAEEIYEVTGDEAAAIAAGRLYVNMRELPPEDMPSREPWGRDAWRAARSLFAQASGITEEAADQQLRSDFSYYITLRGETLWQWSRNCYSDGSGMPTQLWAALMSFVSHECGVDVERFNRDFKAQHYMGCEPCDKRFF